MRLDNRTIVYQMMPVNSIINGLTSLLNDLRCEMGNLRQAAPIDLVVRDVILAIGLPESSVTLVFKPDEVHQIGFLAGEEDHNCITCQSCGKEPATKKIDAGRRGDLLLCDDCADKSS